jgi:hypothetical protein
MEFLVCQMCKGWCPSAELALPGSLRLSLCHIQLNKQNSSPAVTVVQWTLLINPKTEEHQLITPQWWGGTLGTRITEKGPFCCCCSVQMITGHTFK